MDRIRLYGIAAVLLAAAGAFVPFALYAGDEAVAGVMLGDTSLAGKNRREIAALLQERNREIRTGTLVFQHDAFHKELPLQQLEMQVDVDACVTQALSYGRNGDWLQQWWERVSGWWTERPLSCAVQYREDVLTEFVQQLHTQAAADPADARLRLTGNGGVEIVPEVPHLEFDVGEVLAQAKLQLRQQDNRPIELHAQHVVLPAVKTADLQGLDTILGEYTTYYGGDSNRGYNISLAAQAISDRLVPAGTSFSFNDTTGPRSYEAGYREAPVFINGKLEPGSGGGVCQVSSTLFNAALFAGMGIAERTEHFAPVGYMEIGRDATVSYGSLDFVFRNDFARPVYVLADDEPGALTIYILGNAADKPADTDLHRSEVGVIPHGETVEIVPGQQEPETTLEGHDGYTVTWYRNLRWADGRTLFDSFSSYYEPVTTRKQLSPAREDELKKGAEDKRKAEQKEKTKATETKATEKEVTETTATKTEAAERTAEPEEPGVKDAPTAAADETAQRQEEKTEP